MAFFVPFQLWTSRTTHEDLSDKLDSLVDSQYSVDTLQMGENNE